MRMGTGRELEKRPRSVGSGLRGCNRGNGSGYTRELEEEVERDN